MALLPGVSSVGDVELSTDEEGDRGRAAADDLMCLLVTQDQSEGDIMNKLSNWRASLGENNILFMIRLPSPTAAKQTVKAKAAAQQNQEVMLSQLSRSPFHRDNEWIVYYSSQRPSLEKVVEGTM